MVVKSLYYLMAIFSSIFLSVLIQEPYLMEHFAIDRNIAKVKMKNVVNYELTPSRVKSITKAKDIMRYKNKDIAHDVQVLMKKNGYIYSFEGKIGSLIDNILTFRKDVLINRSDGATYKSRELSYDVNREIVSSSVDFSIKGDDIDMVGSSFEYDLKQKIIKADNILAKFNVEDS